MGLEVEAWELGEVGTSWRLGILRASSRLGLMEVFAIGEGASPVGRKLTADAIEIH